jgi:2-haloacid dehalogenase
VAARDCGFRTAFVRRPLEHGPDQTTDLEPESDWDVVVSNFLELANELEKVRALKADKEP